MSLTPKQMSNTLFTFLASYFVCLSAWSQVGQRFPSEKRVVRDKVTGVKVTVLTTSDADDSKIYQTHPQWTYDQKYIIFTSNRDTASRRSKVYAVNVKTGTIIQLTEGEVNASSLNIARKSNKLYYSRAGVNEPGKLIEMDLDALFKDSERGAGKSQSAYERVIGDLPSDIRAGGFTLDANEKVAYIGGTIGGATTDTAQRRVQGQPRPAGQQQQPNQFIAQSPGGLRAMDLQTGAVSKVVDVPFTIGHIQANPYKSGEILFCNETGGDCPQRMWLVNADGSNLKPLYKEKPDEWVSHETWVDANTVYFNLKQYNFYSKVRPNVEDFRVMGEKIFTPDSRKMPTGIFAINVRNDDVKVLGSVDKGHGYWHSNGTLEGKWAMGDNFDGDIYLINVKNGKQTLLTTGHLLVFKGVEHALFHPHATFRPDGKQLFFQSGMYSGGKSYDLMLVDIPADN
jgi:oligogalacturonide lyase